MQLFRIAVPMGLFALVIGALLRGQATGTGLMFGGIFSVCDGYFNGWSELSDVLKFPSLLAAFIVLIAIGYLKLEPRNNVLRTEVH